MQIFEVVPIKIHLHVTTSSFIHSPGIHISNAEEQFSIDKQRIPRGVLLLYCFKTLCHFQYFVWLNEAIYIERGFGDEKKNSEVFNSCLISDKSWLVAVGRLQGGLKVLFL